uniref:Uncharacterized protein n=1 Tax=Ixodes ricinus TaxID=34613 RepID=A0A6B0UVQ3_IXORI
MEGSFSLAICFFTMASKAISGVNSPTRIPCVLRIANAISFRSSFSSNSILTISKGNLSWKSRLMRAPPESSDVLIAADPEPSMFLSKSVCSCWIICSIALVLREGSSGRKFLYSSTSFSMEMSCFCSLSLSPGKVSLMWFVSCWFSTR